MKRISLRIAGLLLAGGLTSTASALDIQPALEGLKAYTSGEEKKSIDALEEAVRTTFGNPAERATLAKQLGDFLLAPADDGGKLVATYYAVLVADDSLIPAAQALLKKPELTRPGASLLRAIHTPKSEAALLAALATPALQVEVLNSFNAQPSPAVVDSVGRLLSGTVPPEVYAAGTNALRRSQSTAAVGVLVGLAENSKGDRRAIATDRAVELLNQLTAGAGAVQFSKPALLALGRLAKLPDLPTAQSTEVFLAQYRLDPAGSSADLSKRLASESAEVFSSAITAVMRSSDPASIKAVAAALGKAPEAYQPALVAALASRDAKDVYPAVLDQAAKTPSFVIPALKAFRQLGTAGQIPQVLGFAAANPLQVRDALAGLPGKEAGKVLLDQLKTAAPAAQITLVQALALRRETVAFETLTPLATSSDDKLRREALNALDLLSQPKDVPALLDAYQKASDDGDRVPLTRALRRLLADPTSATYAPLVRTAYGKEKDPARKNGLLSFVAAIAAPEDLKVLQAAWPATPGPARREWFRAAAFWSGGADGWDVIKQHIAEETDTGTRQLGIQTLADLVVDAPPAQAGTYYRELVALAGDNENALRFLLGKIGKVADPALLDTLQEIGKRPGLAKEVEIARVQLKDAISRNKK